MNRLMHHAIILTIFAIMLVSTGCHNYVTITRYPASSISGIQSTIGNDNFTSQSDNITSRDDINVICVDKITGKELRGDCRVITLTPEQRAEIEKEIEQQKKMYDPNLIRFPSGHLIHVAASTIEDSIYDDEKISNNGYYIIQFYDDMASVDKDTRDLLKQVGCIFYDYVPSYAFYAKIPPEAMDTIISLVESRKVRYLGLIPDEAKIEPELLAKAQENPDTQFNLIIQFFDKANPTLVNSLKDIIRVTSYHYDISNNIFGTAFGSSIPDIMAMNHVKWIEEEMYGTLGNNDGTSAVTENQEFLVILSTSAPGYENEVLAINGLQYIGNVNFIDTNNEEHHAIVISAIPTAVEEIKGLNFVVAVSPIDSVTTIPIPPVSTETTGENSINLFIIAGAAAILVLATIMIFYLRKKHGSHA